MSSSTNLDERHSRFELRTLLETSRLLIESQDPDFVLNNLLLITMGKLLVTKGMILIFKPGENVYYASRAKGRGWLKEDDEIPIDFTDADLETSVLHGEKYASVFEQIGIEKESILFNLKTTNHHIGFLCLGPKGNKQELTEREIEFIESLTIISSVAIANSRMFKEMRHINRRLDRKVHDLNTLLELSKDFNLMVDRDEIARVFKFAMLGQMLIRTFFFALDVDDEKSIVSISGIKEEPSKDDLDKIFELDDVTHISENSDCEFLNENNIRLVIGLKFQNEKIGVVGVGLRGNKQEYGPEEVNFLQSLGNLALLTIQKSLLLDERLQKQRMEEELNLAKNIQIGLLPDPLPEIDRFDLAAINISSRQVGGDYFDFIETPEKNHLVAIADVTGKGVPASLLMANLQSMLHALAPIDVTMSEATGSINDIIYNNTPADKFITFFWGIIADNGTKFKYVNAGHDPPILFRKGSDEPVLLEEGGVILGAMPTMMPYESAEIDLKPGDLIVFFTDGVTEAMNPEQTEEYETDRLKECIRKNRDKTAEEIQDAIITDINAFSNNIQYDDITTIVLKVDE
ncbi:PP2C family protein-serine/threonine phosphatase [Balneola sp. EhC07]|uniref:PP2C family protein-serine/threonine phosphatase n=1 Tax=Balneola sp. EhC07 TaxID=1849360 RepID=UPI001F2B1905|nr:SpoIIE family protein phosphatase [Balneola sp. EhC07]